MPNCSAWRCNHLSERKYIDPKTNKRVTFHKFPHRDPKRMKVWLYNMRRKNFYPSHSAVLCSIHFEESCMDRTGQTNRLRDHAVPTIFPSFPAHLQKTLPKPRRVLQRELPTDTSKPEEDPPQPTAAGAASSGTGTALPGTSKTFCPYFSGPIKVKKSKDSADASGEESPKELKEKLDKSIRISMQLRTQLRTSHQRTRRLKVKVTALTLMVESLRKREAEILRLLKMDPPKWGASAGFLKEAD